MKAKKKDNKKAHAEMQPPWSNYSQSIYYSGTGKALPNQARGDEETVREFVRERTRVHESYIIEEAKTKRLGLILSVVLIVFASGILCFFPKENQATAIWISAALFVFSAGAAGYKRVWGKSKFVSFGANSDDGFTTKIGQFQITKEKT